MHDPFNHGAVDHVPEDEPMYGYWFIYILLGVICFVVLLQSLVVCQLVAKHIKRVPKATDEKAFY